ncbi:MAG: ATP-binding protein [Marinilabiliaceae bacterium]|nr:ATP-binding protein [Marinilabiliaceae bacterium]
MNSKIIKRLPYGNANFESVMLENFAYIDKTKFIEQLEKESNKAQFFIRPRKFGKSLFFSTLSCYYDINREVQFQKLFGDLYIGKNPTPRKNSYAMMEFDFSGIDTHTPDIFRNSFKQYIQSVVIQFIKNYASIFDDAQEIINDLRNHKVEGIGALSVAFQATKVKIFVIIDEYDHFANDLIAMGVNEVYKEMVRSNGIVRDFYETLKKGAKTVVDRIFITGISPVMLDDLTSGFNTAENLTLNKRYNNMLGFTKQEVEQLMDETGVNRDFINVDMEWYYNGYLFNKDATDRIYNPSMMIYFFKQIIEEEKIPEKIIDDNLKIDYGRIQRLTYNEANRETLLQIIKDEGIVSQIVSKFSIDALNQNEYFVSLLFYLGLLTIDKPSFGNVHLRIPNYSIKTVFWEYIMKLAKENAGFTINTFELERATTALAMDGKAQPFIDYIVRNIFSRLSNQDLKNFDEKYIKIMLLNSLFQSNVYVPVSEQETNNGYIDIYLMRSPLMPQVKYEWIFELKYFKATKKLTLSQREHAKSQLKNYNGSYHMKDKKDLKKAVILFVGKNKYEIFE